MQYLTYHMQYFKGIMLELSFKHRLPHILLPLITVHTLFMHRILNTSTIKIFTHLRYMYMHRMSAVMCYMHYNC